MNKVIDYYQAKREVLDSSNLSEDLIHIKKQTIQPLFLDMKTPTEKQVGFLIDLKCGHT